jgi:hypothetical protein
MFKDLILDYGLHGLYGWNLAASPQIFTDKIPGKDGMKEGDRISKGQVLWLRKCKRAGSLNHQPFYRLQF